jgi:hypothetical protein
VLRRDPSAISRLLEYVDMRRVGRRQFLASGFAAVAAGWLLRSPGQPPSPPPGESEPPYRLTSPDEALLEDVERRSFRLWRWLMANPEIPRALEAVGLT